MTDQITVRIEGGNEIAQWLNEIGVSAGDVLEAATLAAAEAVRVEAQALAPSSDGIEKAVQKKSRKRVEVDVAPDKAHWHLKFFETGTQPHEVRPKDKKALPVPGGAYPFANAHVGGMAAQPFLRPAADTKEDAAAGAAGDVFKRAME